MYGYTTGMFGGTPFPLGLFAEEVSLLDEEDEVPWGESVELP